jgi:hypothetical protein
MKQVLRTKVHAVVSWPGPGSFAMDVYLPRQPYADNSCTHLRYEWSVKSAGFQNADAIAAEAAQN